MVVSASSQRDGTSTSKRDVTLKMTDSSPFDSARSTSMTAQSSVIGSQTEATTQASPVDSVSSASRQLDPTQSSESFGQAPISSEVSSASQIRSQSSMTTTPLSSPTTSTFSTTASASSAATPSTAPSLSLRAHSRRQWRDGDGSGPGETQQTCQTTTASTIITYSSSTSWSTTYITSISTKTVVVPTQTIWGGCESTSSTEWAEPTSSSWADGSAWTYSSSEEGYWVESSSSSESDEWWSSSSSWTEAWSDSASSIPSTTDDNSFIAAISSTTSTTATLTSHGPTTISLSTQSPTSTSSTTPTSTISSSAAAVAAASDAATSSTTTASASTAEDNSPHINKSVSIGAAVGGVFGLFAFFAMCLYAVRWWKRRGRVQRTAELRSSWFYGGDVRESKMYGTNEKGFEHGDAESQLEPEAQLPQSRFSAPSLISHSAIPALLRQPISHIRQGSGRFPPILSLKHLRLGWNPDQTARKENGNGTGTWVDKYTTPPTVNSTRSRSGLSRNVSPPRAMEMDSPLESTPTRPRRPDGTVSDHAPDTGVTWGASYTSPTVAQPHHQQWEHGQGLEAEFDHAALSEASHSVYSRTSTYTQHGNALSRGSTLKSMQAGGAGGANEAAATFPMPPVDHPFLHSRSSSNIQTERSLPPPPLPEIPAITFSPNFSHPVSQDYSITRSTQHSSGVWEYSGYDDSSRHTPLSGTLQLSREAPLIQGGVDDEYRATRDWYEKSIWDGGITESSTVPHRPEALGHSSRKSVKSVRWGDEERDLQDGVPRAI
ncbi:hypothetical protein L198_02305 [Cryptococcus wingfieldii CBS 7118]|uniref:T cell CD4 receptor C-terminal region domain-containing protein n=1 Tax=Cryptococcus wingfieldii CBS 7118 TaxID=1295528 RepID=A0A1E3JRE9_9TREE|nr:hypothetical protein L198_02305 [Cryptococcus wingfieldii CBS 7118]ODO03458.1 hypothetical protein L198_02305 [Cryptococcus wingfieldii CBS 7118]